MKWTMLGISAILLAGCGYYRPDAVQYRQVSVAPVVVKTGACDTRCSSCGTTGYYSSLYDCRYGYGWGFVPIDVTTTTVEYY